MEHNLSGLHRAVWRKACVGGTYRLHFQGPKDGEYMFLRNIGIHLQDDTVSQPRKP
jgi:hypothetical protein